MDALNRPYRRDQTSYLAYVTNSALTGFQVALGAMMPLIRDDLDVSLTVASLHFTVMSACGMIGSSLASGMAARFGRRPITIASLIACTVALLSICFAPSVVITLSGAVLLGLCGPFCVIMTQSEVMDHHRAHLATANAELNLIVSLAMLATTLGVGPLVAMTDSWRLSLLMPVAVLVAAYPILHSLQFTDRQRRNRVRTRHEMSPLAWLFCVVVMSQSAFEWCYGYLGAEFMNKVGGLSKESAATSMALYYGGLVTGRVLLVPAVRRFSSYALLVSSFVTALAGFLLMAGGPVLLLKLLGLLVSGFGISIAFPMIANLAGAAFPDATDWIIGKLYVAAGLAVGLAPFAIGSLGDEIGIARSFWVLGGVGLIGLIATQFLSRRLIEHETAPDSAGIARQGGA